MEAKKNTILFNKESLVTVILPYYGYADLSCALLRSLSKSTKEMYENNPDAFHRIFAKRTLKLHYPLWKDRLGPALEKNYRYAQYLLDWQIKFPEDFPVFDEFLRKHPSTRFSHLHLVITEESLENANQLIDTMREIGLINKEVDESYNFLDSSNYCRAANMNTKLRFETEMIIGAEPKAFIDKVEEVGLLDVRSISRCPVEDINMPVYSIKVDDEFCGSFEGGRTIQETFAESVKKAVFEEEISKIKEKLVQDIEYVRKGFPHISSVELNLNGQELKPNDLLELFEPQEVTKVEYEGFEEENAIKIDSTNIFFAIADSTRNTIYKASTFSIEYEENDYELQKDFLVIKPHKINLLASQIVRGEECKAYEGVGELSIDEARIVIHRQFVQNLQFKAVPIVPHAIVPTQTLMMYVDEKEEYDILNNYLNEISNNIPITLEVDMAFVENMENSKQVVTNFFNKNLVRCHIVMEMHEQEFIDHIYELIQNSKTLIEVTPILHQDCTKVIQMIKNSPQVQQWIMDVRIPQETFKDEIKTLFLNDTNNKFVLRDVHEFLIEFRFPTSFEVHLNMEPTSFGGHGSAIENGTA